MKKSFKIFCFGFGQVAKQFVNKLIEKKYDFKLVSTNTNKTENRKFKNINFKSYYFADGIFDRNLINDLDSSNKVLISIPPKGKTDIVLKTFDKNFIKGKFDWVTYLSATSVYGDKKGDWVNEKTIPEPSSYRGISRLNAEKQWIKCFNEFNLPVQIFRLSGIYSNESNIIKRLKAGQLKIVKRKNHFFSRIHVEDIAEVLTISLNKFNPGSIYNISDDYPCSNEEIAVYAANLINMKIPEKINVGQIESKILKDFYKDSKRVNNKKMKEFFLYRLKYPSFKEGLKMISDHYI